MANNNEDKPAYKPHTPKVIHPDYASDSTKSDGPGSANDNKTGLSPAVELIRSKIDAIYSSDPLEPDAEKEIEEVENIEGKRSKHQEYMHELSQSGKSLAEIQTAWHEYYLKLPENEKHEVWQEFYSQADLSKKKTVKKPAPPSSAFSIGSIGSVKRSHETKDSKAVSEMKQQLKKKVSSRAKPNKGSHVKSLLFGLSMGLLSIMVLMFGLFNERIIAPFITPSKSVSNTPIITDLNGTAAGDEPRIIIPKINVDIPVVYDEPSIEEDAFQKALEDGVVHYATTSKPGEKGNSAIFGHSSNNILNPGKYKFAFVLLRRLQNGDTFYLERNGTRYVYKVYKKEVVDPTNLSVLDKQEKPATVSLITCDPPGTVQKRLVVVGEQVSPEPSLNVASSANNNAEADREPEVLPSNAPSVWHRLFGWLGS